MFYGEVLELERNKQAHPCAGLRSDGQEKGSIRIQRTVNFREGSILFNIGSVTREDKRLMDELDGIFAPAASYPHKKQKMPLVVKAELLRSDGNMEDSILRASFDSDFYFYHPKGAIGCSVTAASAITDNGQEGILCLKYPSRTQTKKVIVDLASVRLEFISLGDVPEAVRLVAEKRKGQEETAADRECRKDCDTWRREGLCAFMDGRILRQSLIPSFAEI